MHISLSSSPLQGLSQPDQTSAAGMPEHDQPADFQALLDARRLSDKAKKSDTHALAETKTPAPEKRPAGAGKAGKDERHTQDPTKQAPDTHTAAVQAEAWQNTSSRSLHSAMQASHPARNLSIDPHSFAAADTSATRLNARAAVRPSSNVPDPHLTEKHLASDGLSAGPDLLGDKEQDPASKPGLAGTQLDAGLLKNGLRQSTTRHPAKLSESRLATEKQAASSDRAAHRPGKAPATVAGANEPPSGWTDKHLLDNSEAIPHRMADTGSAASAEHSLTSHTTSTIADSPHAVAGTSPFFATPGTLAPANPSLTLASPIYSGEWPDLFAHQTSALVRQLDNGSHTAMLKLTPPELGQIHIALTLDESVAQAVFSSAHAVVRQALEHALPQLAQQLAQSGIALGEASVNDQQGGHPEPGDEATPDQAALKLAARQAGATPASHSENRTRGLIDTWA